MRPFGGLWKCVAVSAVFGTMACGDAALTLDLSHSTIADMSIGGAWQDAVEDGAQGDGAQRLKVRDLLLRLSPVKSTPVRLSGLSPAQIEIIAYPSGQARAVTIEKPLGTLQEAKALTRAFVNQAWNGAVHRSFRGRCGSNRLSMDFEGAEKAAINCLQDLPTTGLSLMLENNDFARDSAPQLSMMFRKLDNGNLSLEVGTWWPADRLSIDLWNRNQ